MKRRLSRARMLAWAMLILSGPGLIVNPAMAANLTWDKDANGGAGSDGAGTWLTANMWTDLTNAQDWSNSNPDNAIIGVGGTGGAITLDTVAAGTVTFNGFTGTYTLSGGALTLNGALTVTSAAGSITIDTPIGGAGSIMLNSSYAGTVTLSPSAPSAYSGGTTVRAGALSTSAATVTASPGYAENVTPFGSGTTSVYGTLRVTGGVMGGTTWDNVSLKPGSTLRIDTVVGGDRFQNNKPIAMNNGNLWILAGQANATETLGDLTFAGNNLWYMTRTSDGAAGYQTLTFNSIARSGRSTVVAYTSSVEGDVMYTTKVTGGLARGSVNGATVNMVAPWMTFIDRLGNHDQQYSVFFDYDSVSGLKAVTPSGISGYGGTWNPPTGSDGTQIWMWMSGAGGTLQDNADAYAICLNGGGTISSGGYTLNIRGGVLSARGGVISPNTSFRNGSDVEAIITITSNNFDGSGTLTMSGALSTTAGLTKGGDGILALTGNNVGLSGGIVVNGGILRAKNAAMNGNGLTVSALAVYELVTDATIALGGLAGAGTVRPQNNQARTLTLAPAAGAYTFSGKLLNQGSGVLTIIKNGDGTQIFDAGDSVLGTGAYTYTGATTINVGALLVNGTHTGGGNYTINSGGRLGGSGTIALAGANTVTINSGGHLAPGASIGTLTINNNVSVATGIWDLEFNGTTGATDKLMVNGNLTWTGTQTINLANLGSGSTGNPYTFAEWTGTGTSPVGTWNVIYSGSASENHWIGATGGDWDTKTNWNPDTAGGGTVALVGKTLQLTITSVDAPSGGSSVFIDPDANVSVNGPASGGKQTVNNLTIGKGTGVYTAALVLQSGGNLTVLNATTVRSDGTINTTAANLSTATLTVEGAVNVAANTTLTLGTSGAVSAGGVLDLTGHLAAAGKTVTDNGIIHVRADSDSAVGTLNVGASGTLHLGGGSLTAATLTTAGVNTMDAGSKLVVSGTLNANSDLNMTGNTLTTAGATVNVGLGATLTADGLAASTVNVTGTLNPNGGLVNAGALDIAGTLSNYGNITVSSSLNLHGSTDLAMTGGKVLNATGAAVTIGAGRALTVDTQMPAATLVVNGAFSSSGGANVIGAVTVNGAGSLGVSAGTFNAGSLASAGTVNIQSGVLGTIGSVNVTGGNSTLNGASVGAVTASAGVLSAGVPMTSLAVSGTADVTLSGSATISGTLSASAGALKVVNTAGAVATAGTADFSNWTTDLYTVNTQQGRLGVSSQLKLAGGITGTYTAGAAAYFTVQGANIADNSAARTFTLSGGTVTFTAAAPPNLISGVTATAGNNQYATATKAVDWSGMSTPSPDKAATQDCNYQNMWTPGIANSWIRFDLQSAVSLKEMYLWQYNQNYQPGTCCIKTCDIWLSTTGNGTHTSNPSEWTQYNPGNFPWPLTVSGANGDHTVVDMDNINMTARYVMFDNLTNNWGDLTGLSEILFYKTGTGGNVNLPNTHIAATSSSTLDLAAGTENHTLGNFTVSAGAELDVVGVNSLTIGTLTIGINGDNYGKLDLGTQGLTLTGLAVTSVSPTVKECPVAVAAAGSFSTLHATQVTDNGGRKWNVQVREANGVTVNVNGPQLWLVAVPGGTVIMFK